MPMLMGPPNRACYKHTCRIQSCLSENNYDARACAWAIDALKKCCEMPHAAHSIYCAFPETPPPLTKQTPLMEGGEEKEKKEEEEVEKGGNTSSMINVEETSSSSNSSSSSRRRDDGEIENKELEKAVGVPQPQPVEEKKMHDDGDDEGGRETTAAASELPS